jgi:hypothetical protein
LIREIRALAAGHWQAASLVSSRTYDCSYASTYVGETRDKKAPTPKNATRKLEHDGDCRHYEAESYENVHDAFLKAWLYFSFASPISFSFTTNTRAEVVRLRGLWQLSGERLRDQADVGTTDAAKAGAVEILSCTVWTKHSHLPSTSRRTRIESWVELRFLPFQLPSGSLSQSFKQNNACGH